MNGRAKGESGTALPSPLLPLSPLPSPLPSVSSLRFVCCSALSCFGGRTCDVPCKPPPLHHSFPFPLSLCLFFRSHSFSSPPLLLLPCLCFPLFLSLYTYRQTGGYGPVCLSVCLGVCLSVSLSLCVCAFSSGCIFHFEKEKAKAKERERERKRSRRLLGWTDSVV